MLASSLTVTNSVNLRMPFSASFCRCSSSICWLTAALFWRRCLAPFDFPEGESRASVSLICFWISSSLSSGFGASFLFLPFRPLSSCLLPDLSLTCLGVLIRLRFFFCETLSSLEEATGLRSNSFRSILSRIFGPLSLSTFVSMKFSPSFSFGFSFSASIVSFALSSAGSAFSSVFAAGASSFASTSFFAVSSCSASAFFLLVSAGFFFFSASAFFSSFVLRAGRVFWFMLSRSILSTTLSLSSSPAFSSFAVSFTSSSFSASGVCSCFSSFSTFFSSLASFSTSSFFPSFSSFFSSAVPFLTSGLGSGSGFFSSGF